MRLRCLLLLAAAVLLMLAVTPGVLSGLEPTVKLGSFTADVGQEVTVDLRVLNIGSSDLGDWEVKIDYDSSIVSAKSCTPTVGGGFCNSSFGEATITKLGVSIPGLEGDFSLARIEFTCQSGGSSGLSLSVNEFNDATLGNPQPINPVVQNGKITCLGEPAPTATNTEVPMATNTPLPTTTPAPEPSATESPVEPTETEEMIETPSPTATLTPTARPTKTSTPSPLLGDTDCDGRISSLDALLILQFAAALISSLPCPENADISGDGETNPLDSALILQITAGLI